MTYEEMYAMCEAALFLYPTMKEFLEQVEDYDELRDIQSVDQ